MRENFYLGADEYIIFYKDGIHHIKSCETQEVVFTGHYEKCIAKRDEMYADYLESRF